jgi:hypothetical protein
VVKFDVLTVKACPVFQKTGQAAKMLRTLKYRIFCILYKEKLRLKCANPFLLHAEYQYVPFVPFCPTPKTGQNETSQFLV